LTDTTNKACSDQIIEWANVSSRIFIWDYVTNFNNFIQSFPNYYKMGADIKFFAAHHVTGLFSEGSYASAGGDMDVLKAYVVGNMLMEPGLDPSELISSWLAAYFGPAQPWAVYSFSRPGIFHS
jgi:hypothetical protein